MMLDNYVDPNGIFTSLTLFHFTLPTNLVLCFFFFHLLVLQIGFCLCVLRQGLQQHETIEAQC